MTSARLLVRAAMFGAAIGGRFSLLLAGPVLARGLARRAGVATILTARPPANPGAVALIAVAGGLGGELVGDKLPAAPSRLDPPTLVGRVVAAIAGGVVLARRGRTGVVLPIVAAVLAAVAEVNAGARWPSHMHKRGWSMAGGLAEDAVLVTMALIACWPRPGDQWRGHQRTGRRRS